MNIVPLVIAVCAVLFATAAAAADGALLGAEPEPEPPARGGSVARRKEHAHRALSLFRVLAHITAGVCFAEALHIARGDGLQGAALSFLIALLVVVTVEGIGRSIGFASAQQCSSALAPFVRAVELLLTPLLAVGAVLDRVVERAMPSPTVEQRAEQREETAEQFRHVVTSEADVTRAEKALLHGVFSLGDTTVHEIMIPRVDIVGIENGTPWSEVVDRVLATEHARFPVYTDTLDNVTGILFTKDLLPYVIDDEEPMLGWEGLARPPQFIPTSKPIDVQLREFKQSRNHIAIVSDEFGGTAGLVTIEDVLEEIVGEIHDEYDVDEPEIVQEEGIRYWVNGRITLEELSELLRQDFEMDDVSTVGGLVYETFGKVPKAGESQVIGAYKLVVERVRKRRIERVFFERVTGSAMDEAE